MQRFVGWGQWRGLDLLRLRPCRQPRYPAARVGPGTFFDQYEYNRASGPNRLVGVASNTPAHTVYDFDADGAVTGRRDTSLNTHTLTAAQGFTNSYRGLVRQFTSNDVSNGTVMDWRYRYNAMGEREQKRLYDLQAAPHGVPTSRVWEYYLLGGSREQLAVYHGRDSVGGACTVPGANVFMYPVEYNTYTGGTTNLTTLPDAVLPSGVRRYKVSDHLGSVRVVLDGSGVPVDSIDYEPFGKALASSGQRLSYIDKEQDKESGLGDFGVRKYGMETGRFESIDPLWEHFRSLSPYAYVNNSPLTIRDPRGMTGDSTTGEGPTEPPETPEPEPQPAPDPNQSPQVRRERIMPPGEIDESPEPADLTPVTPAEQAKHRADELGTNPKEEMDRREAPEPTTTWNPSRAGHIFRNAPGHINPSTLQEATEAIQLFRSVSSNYRNYRPDFVLPPGAVQVGIQAYTQNIGNGNQVWVFVLNGEIQDAGINPPGAHR